MPAEKIVKQRAEEETFLNKPTIKKRNSILKLLLNNNKYTKKSETVENKSPNLNEETSQEESTMQSIPEHNEVCPETIPLKAFHRKRSISTPNLKALGVDNLSNFESPKNNSNTNIPVTVQRYLDDTNLQGNKFHRTMSLKTRTMRGRTQSDTAQSIASKHSLRIKRSRLDRPSTSSTLPRNGDHNQPKNGIKDQFNRTSSRSTTKIKR